MKKIDRENYTKICNICNKKLSLDNFYFNGKYTNNKIKYKPSCITCSNKQTKIKYISRLSRLKNLLESNNIKYRCTICSYNTNYSALDFHHINPKTKLFNISAVAKTCSEEYMIKKVLPEIKKCIILCSNCHRELHNPLYNIENFRGNGRLTS